MCLYAIIKIQRKYLIRAKTDRCVRTFARVFRFFFFLPSQTASDDIAWFLSSKKTELSSIRFETANAVVARNSLSARHFLCLFGI